MTTDPQSPDEIDRLFGTYLKAQLPQRWPDAPVSAEPANRHAADPASRSRLTLAASAAVLLGLGLYLSGGRTPPTEPNPTHPPFSGKLMKDSTASGRGLFPMTPQPHQADPASAEKSK